VKALTHIHRKFNLYQGNDLPPVIHVSTAKTWRGGEQQLVYLYDELEKAGIPQLILCRKDGELAVRCEVEERNILPIPKRTGMDMFAAKTLKKVCRFFQAGIVHVHDANAHTTAFISAKFFGNKTPVVVSRRVDFPIKPGKLSKAKYNFQELAAILCVSEKIKEITAPGIIQPSKLHVVHSGIDLGRFSAIKNKNILRKEFNITQSTVLIGNVAALAPHKDYFTFLDTAAHLRDLDVKFFIIGKGELEAELKAYTNKLKLNDKVIFTGFRDDVLDVLSSLDIFLITSKTEGLGTSILDAFACGVPVVATQAGGIPELVTHEQTGLLAPIKDSEELANQIKRLLENPSLKTRFIANAKIKLDLFSKTHTAAKTLAIYRGIVGV
jgi:L-malate glycosyltransferase